MRLRWPRRGFRWPWVGTAHATPLALVFAATVPWWRRNGDVYEAWQVDAESARTFVCRWAFESF